MGGHVLGHAVPSLPLDPASFPTDRGIVFQTVMSTVANSGVECAMDLGSTLAKGQQVLAFVLNMSVLSNFDLLDLASSKSNSLRLEV